jgi:hypothetical protein
VTVIFDTPVCLPPGNSSSREEALTIMDRVLPLNISLVALDFSGCGHSEGEFITLGWHEKDDVATVVPPPPSLAPPALHCRRPAARWALLR